MKQKNSGMVMSIGRQLPHMLTPRSFMSFCCSRFIRWGSSLYFFCRRWISGWMACIFMEDLRVLMSEKTVSPRRTTVLIRIVKNTLPMFS